MTIYLHQYDLPNDVVLSGSLAIDTETLGLNPHRDRLCVVQLSTGNGDAYLVHFPTADYRAPNLRKLLKNRTFPKLFHFGRFDIVVIEHYLGVKCKPVYCTKIASKLVRTYTDRHGLKDLCKELLDVDLSKQQQTSHWGAETLSPEQQAYAASDVLYLHSLKEELDQRLEQLKRTALAKACFDFLPTRASLDLAGWPDTDIFAHSG
jgi:ribonuclease D